MLIVTTYKGSQKFQSILQTYFPGVIGLIYTIQKTMFGHGNHIGEWEGKRVDLGRFYYHWGKLFFFPGMTHFGNCVAKTIIYTFCHLGWHHTVLSERFWVNGYDS